MREIEIKLRVDDLDELEKKLAEKGLVISKELYQYDVIYSQNDPSIFTGLKPGGIVVRIRDENGKLELNLKQQQTHELDNIEWETEVKDREAIHNILLLLGWKPEVEVKKVRKKGKLGEYEICLDRVEELGNFVELEKLADENANPEKIRQELINTLRQFGLNEKDEEAKGYDTQIYQLKNNEENRFL